MLKYITNWIGSLVKGKGTSKSEDVQVVNPFYLRYDGDRGYAQVLGGVEKRHVGIRVNSNEGGQHTRIMRVTKQRRYGDLGGMCTELHFERTGYVLDSQVQG